MSRPPRRSRVRATPALDSVYSLGAQIIGSEKRRVLKTINRLANQREVCYGFLAPMFGVDIPIADLPAVLAHLMVNHGPLQVLIHPVTDDELMDHTHHALWLGQPQPLNLAVLR